MVGQRVQLDGQGAVSLGGEGLGLAAGIVLDAEDVVAQVQLAALGTLGLAAAGAGVGDGAVVVLDAVLLVPVVAQSGGSFLGHILAAGGASAGVGAGLGAGGLDLVAPVLNAVAQGLGHVGLVVVAADGALVQIVAPLGAGGGNGGHGVVVLVPDVVLVAVVVAAGAGDDLVAVIAAAAVVGLVLEVMAQGIVVLGGDGGVAADGAGGGHEGAGLAGGLGEGGLTEGVCAGADGLPGQGAAVVLLDLLGPGLVAQGIPDGGVDVVEGVVADDGSIAGEDKVTGVPHGGQGVAGQLGQGGGQGQLGHAAAAAEGVLADGGDALGQDGVAQGAAVEGVGADGGQVLVPDDLIQGTAGGEAALGDLGDSGGELDGLQGVAACEGVAAEGSHGVSQLHSGQLAALVEGVVADGGDALLHHDSLDVVGEVIVPGSGVLVGVGVQVVVHLAGAGDGQLAEPVQGPGQVVAAGTGDQIGLAAVDAAAVLAVGVGGGDGLLVARTAVGAGVGQNAVLGAGGLLGDGGGVLVALDDGSIKQAGGVGAVQAGFQDVGHAGLQHLGDAEVGAGDALNCVGVGGIVVVCHQVHLRVVDGAVGIGVATLDGSGVEVVQIGRLRGEGEIDGLTIGVDVHAGQSVQGQDGVLLDALKLGRVVVGVCMDGHGGHQTHNHDDGQQQSHELVHFFHAFYFLSVKNALLFYHNP